MSPITTKRIKNYPPLPFEDPPGFGLVAAAPVGVVRDVYFLFVDR